MVYGVGSKGGILYRRGCIMFSVDSNCDIRNIMSWDKGHVLDERFNMALMSKHVDECPVHSLSCFPEVHLNMNRLLYAFGFVLLHRIKGSSYSFRWFMLI